MRPSQSHDESLQQQLRIHEDRLDLLRWQMSHVREGGQGLNEGSVRLNRKTLQKVMKAAPDPNRKHRSPEWIAHHRRVLEREISIHERLLELGRNPKVLEALNALAENRAYASEAARDPRLAARARGIELPQGMVLHVELEIDRVRLRVDYHESHFPFSVTWTSDNGFLPPRDPNAQKRAAGDSTSQGAGDR